jgi:hypothetical protein
MSRGSLLNTPVLWINTYIQEKLAVDAKIGVPFFPSLPSSIDDLTERWITVDSQNYGYAGVMATWDRMFRMRRQAFPHVRIEQILYYFYATAENVTENMVQVQEELLRLLDRGDESAQEINKWMADRGPITINSEIIEPGFFFHDFKIFQLEEVRDIIDFGTARTFGGNKIVIEYTYHQITPKYEKIDTEFEAFDPARPRYDTNKVILGGTLIDKP